MNMKKNKVKKSAPVYIFQTFNYIFLAALVLLCLYPMWYCLMASISNPGAMMRHMGPLLLPKGFSLASYGKVFANPNIISGYKNTIFILVVGVILCLLMTSLGAYVLSRKDLLFRKPLMMIIMFTMFFTGGLIPTYLNLKELHLTNSLWGLIIPDSLIEAAQIDGASHWKILISIVLPLSKATLAVMVLYYGVEKWNGWFWASALIRNRELLPLQVILREILLSSTQSMQTGAGAGDTEAIGATIRYATTIVATVPILCVYPFVQKHFTKGVMVGAVKE